MREGRSSKGSKCVYYFIQLLCCDSFFFTFFFAALLLRVRFLHLADKQPCVYVAVCVMRFHIIHYVLRLTDDAIKVSFLASCHHIGTAVPLRRLPPCCTFSVFYSKLWKTAMNMQKKGEKVGCLHHKQPDWRVAVRSRAFLPPAPQPSQDPSEETVTPLIFKCGISAAKSWCHGEWLSSRLEGFSSNGAKWDRGEGGRWRRDPTGLGCIEILQGARDNEIEKRFFFGTRVLSPVCS